MKVLYFSMSCNEQTWNDIQKNSKIKASASPYVYDTLVLKGLFQIKNISLEVYSFPSISSFPGSRKLGWGAKSEEIFPGLNTKWLPAINFLFLKQISFFLSALYFCTTWIIKNRKEKAKQIIIYSTYFPVALPVVLTSMLFNFSSTTIITDIPKFNFLNQNFKNSVKRFFINAHIKSSEFIQSKFDKYIFLTEQMNDSINVKNKPYIIIEGICDHNLFEEYSLIKKNELKAIMYAGALNKQLGIPLLLQIFNEIGQDIDFWVFGSGDYQEEVRKISNTNPKIKFFGKVNRKSVLIYEKKASLLINMRNAEEEFTKYSFPSKTMEYMLSGTPLLTSKLPGIPNEYYDYVYTIESYNENEIKSKIIEIISKDAEELSLFGNRASQFVKNHKNYIYQGLKIYKLLETN